MKIKRRDTKLLVGIKDLAILLIGYLVNKNVLKIKYIPVSRKLKVCFLGI